MFLELDTLTQLVDQQDKDTFYYKDFSHPEGGDSYRIFNYRLASFRDFMEHDALKWCRGTMFNLRTGMVVSRPMEKFFNYHEWVNNSTELPESEYWNQAVKHDGSLVSTYIHSDGHAYLKSKFSLESEQAVRATEVFRKMAIEEHGLTPRELQDSLNEATSNFEYVAPTNLIVVPYSEEKIIPINLIHNETGVYHADSKWVGKVNSAVLDEWADVVYDDSETLHEGYVMVSDCGQHRFKLKTNRYLAAHRAKDDINSTKKLLMIVYSGDIDDLLNCKDLGADKSFQDILINKTEFIKDIINSTVSECENFYESNKNLDRKSYAIKSQESSLPLGCLMNLYLDRDPEYLNYFLKNLDMFEEAA